MLCPAKSKNTINHQSDQSSNQINEPIQRLNTGCKTVYWPRRWNHIWNLRVQIPFHPLPGFVCACTEMHTNVHEDFSKRHEVSPYSSSQLYITRITEYKQCHKSVPVVNSAQVKIDSCIFPNPKVMLTVLWSNAPSIEPTGEPIVGA